MIKFELKLPKIVFGRGKIYEIGHLCEGLGKKAFVVTGKSSAQRSGSLNSLISALSSQGKEVTTFSITQEPSVDDVDRARSYARGSDFIIGIGGGSVLDVAKATAGLLNEDKPTADFLFGRAEIKAHPLPIIAIPTTAGTGSEVTKVSVLKAQINGKRIKSSIHHPNLIPSYSILAPELTLSCPPSITASAGLDALTHCIESFFSREANPLSDAIAMQGIRLIMKNLQQAYEKGTYESREAMLLGSLCGGISLSIAHLGAIHSLAHSLGALKDIPHGIACGVFLPAVLKFNHTAIKEKLEFLANYLEMSPDSFLRKIEEMLELLGIPKSLKELGVNEEEAEKIVEGCAYSRSLKYNPIPVSPSDLLSIVRSSL
ncbi:iron-containing alcohol dehydrogenase [bacterium]|nr:iron-containing alcohol dehydrogenase [bacterium]